MTKRRLLLIASLPLTVVVTLGVLAMLPSDDRPGVTKANYDRIKRGMTKAEVEEVFGETSDLGMRLNSAITYEWRHTDGSCAEVTFSLGGLAARKQWHDSNESFLDRIRRWLHLQ